MSVGNLQTANCPELLVVGSTCQPMCSTDPLLSVMKERLRPKEP